MYVGGIDISQFLRQHFPTKTYGLGAVMLGSPLMHDTSGFYVVKNPGTEHGWDCWDAAVRIRQEFGYDGQDVDIAEGRTRVFGRHFFNVVESSVGTSIIDAMPLYRQLNGRHIQGYIILSDDEIRANSHSRRIDLNHPVPVSYQRHNGLSYLSFASVSMVTISKGQRSRVALETNEVSESPSMPVQTIRTAALIRPEDVAKLDGRFPNSERELAELIREGVIHTVTTSVTRQNPFQSDVNRPLELFHQTNLDVFHKLTLDLMQLSR